MTETKKPTVKPSLYFKLPSIVSTTLCRSICVTPHNDVTQVNRFYDDIAKISHHDVNN